MVGEGEKELRRMARDKRDEITIFKENDLAQQLKCIREERENLTQGEGKSKLKSAFLFMEAFTDLFILNPSIYPQQTHGQAHSISLKPMQQVWAPIANQLNPLGSLIVGHRHHDL